MLINLINLQRATSQYKQAGEWDKAAETLATMADIYRRQVLMMLLMMLLLITILTTIDHGRHLQAPGIDEDVFVVVDINFDPHCKQDQQVSGLMMLLWLFINFDHYCKQHLQMPMFCCGLRTYHIFHFHFLCFITKQRRVCD